MDSNSREVVENTAETSKATSGGCIGLILSGSISILTYPFFLSQRFLNEERNREKSTTMLPRSIGDQIIWILEMDAHQPEDSAEKTNARLALKILARVKAEEREMDRSGGLGEKMKRMRNELLKELYQADINPHLLAVRWLTVYINDWRDRG